MKRLSSHIIIGEYSFRYVVDVNIDSSIENLTDTCNITLPRKLFWNGENIAIDTNAVFKRGMKVTVNIGYDDDLKTRFVGYIKNIKAGTPVTLECEDSMYLLKTGSITKSYASANLKSLFSDIMPTGISYVAQDVSFGAIRISNASPAKILETLKSDYGIYSYFRLINNVPVLYSSLAYYYDVNVNEHTFNFGNNIIEDSNLTYKIKEDIKIKVKAISILQNNLKIEITKGDEDGEERTIHRYGITKMELEKYAEAELERYKVDGYKGTFDSFGEPAVFVNDIVSLSGNNYFPSGRYKVKSIKTSFGKKGYKQTIEPDIKL